MAKSVDMNTISELAAALTKSGSCPDLPRKLLAFINENPGRSEYAVALKVVAILGEIKERSSSSFNTDLANFVKALLAISRACEAKGCVRIMAVKVLLCIVEDEDMRTYLTIPEFASELAHSLLELNFKEDVAELGANPAKGLYVKLSGEGLERVASEIGEENVKNSIFGCILEYLKKDEWRYKQIAMMAISVTVKYLPKEGVETLLGEVVELVVEQLNNQQEDVRFATCQAIGQIAEKSRGLSQKGYGYFIRDMRGLFQERYAYMILPLLVIMFDDPSRKVQSSAVAAFNSMAKGTEAANLMLFADKVINTFLERITPENSGTVREQCVEGIAVVARVIEKKFMKYYSLVVPVITRIIVASSNKEEKAIRGKAMECINSISQAVGDEIMQANAHEVMQVLLQIDAAGLEVDDPLKRSILETFCQMCRTLKGEFVPYLPQLIPKILKVLSIEHQPDNHKENKAKVNDFFLMELKKLELGEVFRAIDLLTTCIEIFGEKFGEYLVPVAQSLLSLLSSPVYVTVKLAAMDAVGKVFTVARKSSNPATRQVLNQGVEALLETVFKDLDPCDNHDGITDFHCALLMAQARTLEFRVCLREAGPDVLNAQQVQAICEKVLRLMKESNQRRGKIATGKDDPEQVLFKDHLMLMGWVMAYHADLYLQTGAELCRKFIETHLDPNCAPDDRAMALYVFAYVLEYLMDKGALLWPTFASRLVECIGDADPRVRQAAAYGVIQAAERCSQFPAELIEKAADKLFALISAKQSQEEAFLSATDSMIAALGTIVVHRDNCLRPSPEQFFNLWLSNLPLKVDYKEGRRTHGDLVDVFVEITSEGRKPQKSLPQVAAICASIYRTDFTTPETDKGIRDFVQKIGIDAIYSAGANFDEKIQKGLKKIHQDCQTSELSV